MSEYNWIRLNQWSSTFRLHPAALQSAFSDEVDDAADTQNPVEQNPEFVSGFSQRMRFFSTFSVFKNVTLSRLQLGVNVIFTPKFNISAIAW